MAKQYSAVFPVGGGSSMGYKLAGYSVIGNCEIDKAMNDLYKLNNKPVFNYEMDIRKFIEIEEYPKELENLDILDGSPPCSTFSMAGQREEAWGKEKRFREGQKKQTLDDLFFEFIKVADRLKPKVVVSENVKGLIAGNARGYVNEIIKGFDKAGYKVQVFLLNSAIMGVPQRRERVFIIGQRKDLKLNNLILNFDEKPILYKDFADSEYGQKLNTNTETFRRWQQRSITEKSVGDTVKHIKDGKVSGFTQKYLKMNEVSRTLTAGSRPLRFDVPYFISDKDVITIQTFPQDYNFNGEDPVYVCGMSVPPVMMAQISSEIYEQWLRGKDK